MLNIKNEGIHLTAIVRYANPRPGEPRGYMKMEDDDYNSKEDFRRDLRNNGYLVRSVSDNRDLYLMDNSNYTSMGGLLRDIKYYKNELKKSKDKYPTLSANYKKSY